LTPEDGVSWPERVFLWALMAREVAFGGGNVERVCGSAGKGSPRAEPGGSWRDDSRGSEERGLRRESTRPTSRRQAGAPRPLSRVYRRRRALRRLGPMAYLLFALEPGDCVSVSVIPPRCRFAGSVPRRLAVEYRELTNGRRGEAGENCKENRRTGQSWGPVTRGLSRGMRRPAQNGQTNRALRLPRTVKISLQRSHARIGRRHRCTRQSVSSTSRSLS
jgi:hypothetical protein